MLLWLFIAVIAFIVCLTLFVVGIKKKSRKSIYISLLFLFISLGAGACTAALFVNRMYHSIKTAKLPSFSRTGREMYVVLYGQPIDTCLHVIHATDQVAPRLDCCIWLELQTCPKELQRMIAQRKFKLYEPQLLDLDSTGVYVPQYSPRPAWFNPKVLGDNIHILRQYKEDDPNHDIVLYFSKDSTHALYCDMAD